MQSETPNNSTGGMTFSSRSEKKRDYGVNQVPTKKHSHAKRKQLNVKTLQHITANKPFVVIPSEIIFRDIESNYIYEVPILIRNLTKYPKRLRIFQPKTPQFKCLFDWETAKAAGIAFKLTVTFETEKIKDYEDSFSVVFEDGQRQEIPIYAYAPKAVIVFEPFVNFGFVQIGEKVTQSVFFKNTGTVEDQINLEHNSESNLMFQPHFFPLLPGQKQEVEISYSTGTAGIFRGRIDIECQGHCDQKVIHITATSVEYHVFLVDEEGLQALNIDYGNLYFGQIIKKHFFLVNNSPQATTFSVDFQLGNQVYDKNKTKYDLLQPYEQGLEKTQNIMSCLPEKGRLDAYEKIPITIICTSELTEECQIWTQQYSMLKVGDDENLSLTEKAQQPYELTILFNLGSKPEEPLRIPIKAQGVCPQIKFSETILNFGECPVNEYKDLMLFIENKHKELDVLFEFPQISNFSCKPKRTVLRKQGTNQLIVTFKPNNLGNFTQFVTISLFHGVYKIPLKCEAFSRTMMKIPKRIRGPESNTKDFVIQNQYVTQKDLQLSQAFLRRKHKKFLFKSVKSLRKFTIGSIDETIKVKTIFQTRNFNEFIMKKRNQQKYNKFMKQRRIKRISQKKQLESQQKYRQIQTKTDSEAVRGIDFVELYKNSPVDYDFWNKRELGLRTPRYTLPKPNEILYVIRPIGKYLPTQHFEPGFFRPDYNKINKNKYPSKTKNLTIQRQCRTALSGEDMKKVFIHPNVINLGHVFDQSQIRKSFVVRNEMIVHLQVQLETEHEELLESYLTPQILPPSQVGWFDVVFNALKVGRFEKKITYILNGHHPYEFYVLAEVVEADLRLDKQDVVFQYESHNIKMYATETLTLFNDGNAEVKFDIKLPLRSVFKVKPIEDVVQPNSSATVTFYYTPLGKKMGKNDVATAQVNIRYGQPKFLKLSGITQSVIIKCLESLNFGVCPVSVRQERVLRLKNVSKFPTVFSINKEKRPLHVVFKPNQARLAPEDTTEILCTYVCSENMEEPVTEPFLIDIRGSESIIVKYFVQTKIPNVYIQQDKFNFGEIQWGNRKKMEMQIVNDSKLEAQLVLDLREIGVNGEEVDGINGLDIEYIKQKDEKGDTVMISLEKHPQEQCNFNQFLSQFPKKRKSKSVKLNTFSMQMKMKMKMSKFSNMMRKSLRSRKNQGSS